MKCKICNKNFNNYLELTSHLVREHEYKSEDLYKYFKYSFETGEATCPVCGNEFTLSWRQKDTYKKGKSKGIGCSLKCSNKIIELIYGNPSCRPEVKEKKKQKALEKYGVENVFQAKDVKEKIKQTNLEKYGVEYVMQSSEMLEKSKETNLEKYGVEHVSQRKDIKERKKKKSLDKYGVENISQAEEIKEKKKQAALEKYGVEYTLQAFEVREKSKKTSLEKYGVEYAAQAEEVKEKIKQTNLEKYVVEYTSQVPEVKEKIKQTNLRKYGVEYAISSEEVRKKSKETIKEKYGVDHIMRSPEIKERMRERNVEKYGVENVSQIPEVKDKVKNTNLKKFGVEYPFQSPEIREKGKKTSLEKYGVEWAIQSPEIQNKVKETNLEKYGTAWATQSSEAKEKRKETSIKKYGVPYVLMAEEVKEKVRSTVKEKYNVEFFCQHERCVEAGGKRISNINKEFHKLLKDNGIESELEFIIDNSGYDIKVGNTLIEIDPYYTHNLTVPPYFRRKKGNCIPFDYHILKTNFAKEHGFKCIHVFDWDGRNKVLNLLQSKEKVQARKCQVQEIDKKVAKEFLERYHLQGSTKQHKFSYGLFYEGELIEVMTFGKPRYNKNYEYELLRLCTSPKISVIGGASRLLSYFEEKVKPTSLISYCDLSKFNGEVYERLGFKLKEQTQPAIHWYNPKTKRHITDNLLRQRGFDQLHGANFGKGTSNEELMVREGYVKIPDCGQLVFVKNY